MQPTFLDDDIRYMQLALNLANQARHSTSPNPRVGSVIVKNGHIIGQGYHVKAGGPHAEVIALHEAGSAAEGATAYVTLEPCSHTGRTGPCALALVNAKVARVVAAIQDPDERVVGRGFALLKAAGIEVSCGVLSDEARELNRGFLSRIERKRPFVRLKTAVSLDNKTALSNGKSQWVTSSAARDDVQLLRAESCAIITGIGTVLADNPQLNVRAFKTLRQPCRVILDTHALTPHDARVVTDAGSPTLIYTARAECFTHPHFAADHVQVAPVPLDGEHLDLSFILNDLAARGFGEVMIEAGSRLNSTFLAQHWVDELVIYQAPKILGNAATSAWLLPENETALQQNQWLVTSVQTVGADVKQILRRAQTRE